MGQTTELDEGKSAVLHDTVAKDVDDISNIVCRGRHTSGSQNLAYLYTTERRGGNIRREGRGGSSWPKGERAEGRVRRLYGLLNLS